MTGEGRVPAGDFRAIVDARPRRGRFEPIDRASGGLIDWPGGNAQYAYGAYFHQYLADRYGPESLRRSPTTTAGACPTSARRRFKNVFGRSLGALWDDFRRARHGSSAQRGRDDRDTAHPSRVLGDRAAVRDCRTALLRDRRTRTASRR